MIRPGAGLYSRTTALLYSARGRASYSRSGALDRMILDTGPKIVCEIQLVSGSQMEFSYAGPVMPCLP